MNGVGESVLSLYHALCWMSFFYHLYLTLNLSQLLRRNRCVSKECHFVGFNVYSGVGIPAISINSPRMCYICDSRFRFVTFRR